jgi:hypothetical protein
VSLPGWQKEVLATVGVVLAIFALTDRSALVTGKLSAQKWMALAQYRGGAILVALFFAGAEGRI